ncbi:phosphatase PAP2 family protein [Effusibacillus dendaii]|uniref:Undecaprenyl-diphosphatase BcrC n=1 Tax=Effusibacillus dendaii TaxID=2743772 RepID=A0A7I8DIV3_9BACL|nr:phosphatase PAP2 family protein [Effusibacillus dendaii]BCJ87771.1 undecaprenyl-diphosphatase BcrC [Effusibacillus dendaii]
MNFDFQLFQMINGIAGHNHALDRLVALFTTYGPTLFGLLLVWIWFSRKGNLINNRKTAILAVLAALVALAINQLIGSIYSRPRPFVNHTVNLLVSHSADFSFPSDHSAGAFALAFALLRLRNRFAKPLLVLAVLLGLSRIYVGAHYPTDVLGGVGTAAIANLLVSWQQERLQPVVRFLLKIWDRLFGRFSPSGKTPSDYKNEDYRA